MAKIKPKVVIFQIHNLLYKEIKSRALKKGIPMRLWITRAVVALMKEEDKFKKV